MKKMTKIERVNAAIKGKEVDRVPVSFWYHFGLHHLPGEVFAEAELDFFKTYDLDFLKVMHDYPYPQPKGLTEITKKDDWLKLKPLKYNEGGFKEQLRALKIIGKELKGKAYYIDTIFSPWSTAHKLCGENLTRFMKESPDELLKGLYVIAQSFANYCEEAVKQGLSGIFLSLGGASYDIMSEAEYAKFGRPFDLMVLDAVEDAPFNVLHIHGTNIHFESLLDYPVDAINWSHRHSPPNIVQARKAYDGCIIVGVDETNTSSVHPDDIKAQILETFKQAGTRKLIIGPGCAVPTQTSVANLSSFKQTVEEYFRKEK